jgi:hypothetical protein
MLKDLVVQIEEEGEQLEKTNGNLGSMGEFGQTGAIAPAPPVETYGAGLMRQLVPMLTQLLQQNRKAKSTPRLQDLVAGAAQAREAGMDDLADHMMCVVKRTCDQAFDDEESALPVEDAANPTEQPKE